MNTIRSRAMVGGLWLCVLVVCLHGAAGISSAGHSKAANPICGGWLNGTRGFLHTPNFPKPFPTPLDCQWIIHAPLGKKIVLYFTQFYVRSSFTLEEYKYYKDDSLYVEKTELGEVNFDDYYAPFEALKPYLVIRFRRQDMGKIHYRVDEYFVDVYGFNITYEIVDKFAGLRPDHCSLFQCSFLGHCYASQHFDSYKCHCFRNFHGTECQYGPYCNPALGVNLCKNGGRCRYFLGSSVNECDCLPGYTGPQCQDVVESYIDQECGDLGCNQKCERSEDDGEYHCACHPGHRLQEDNKTCVENGRTRYYGEIRLPVDDVDKLCDNFTSILIQKVQSEVTKAFPEYKNYTVTHNRYDDGFMYVGFYFIGDKSSPNLVFGVLITMLKRNVTVCNLTCDSGYIVYDAQPALHSVSLHNYENMAVIEGQLLTLVCKAKGSMRLQFQWLKDGVAVDMDRTGRNIWETRIPSPDEETHISVLNIEKVHHLDEGTFLCNATDWGEFQVKSIYVSVVPIPVAEVFPLISTVEEGKSVALTCLSREDEQAGFMYRWQMNDEPIVRGVNDEVIEDLLPTGTRLRLQNVQQSANYTCKISSRAGVASKTARVVRVDPGEKFCQPETKDGIRWTQTTHGMWDLQACPSDSYEFIGDLWTEPTSHFALHGWSRRSCTCPGGKECYWEEPDYQNCTSYSLRSYYRKITLLSLGYKISTVQNFTSRLLGRMQKSGFNFRGDVGVVTKILRTLLEFTRDFIGDDELDAQSIVGMINASMTEAIIMHSNYYLPDIPLSVMSLVELLSSNIKLYETSPTEINTKAIDLYSICIDSEVKSLFAVKNKELDVFLDPQTNLSGNHSVNITAAIYRNDTFFKNAPYPGLMEYSLASSVLTLGIMQSPLTVQYDRIVHYFVRFHHGHLKEDNMETKARVRHVKCATLENGVWALDNTCKLIPNESTSESSLCKCAGPNHLALAAKHAYIEVHGKEKDVPAFMILVSSIISLIAFVLVALLNVCCLRHSIGKGILMHLQYVCVLIAVDGLLIGGLFKSSQPVLCQSITILLLITVTAALALVLADSVNLYKNIVQKTSVSACHQMTVVFGILLLMAILLATLSVKIGLSETKQLCWVSYPQWEMILFAAVGGLTLMIYMVYLSLACKALVSSPKDKEVKQKILVVCRCLINQALLVGGIICSIILATHPMNLIAHYCFGAFHCCLALFHLHLTLCKCVNKQQCLWSFQVDKRNFDFPNDCAGLILHKNKVLSCIWESDKLYHCTDSCEDPKGRKSSATKRSAEIDEALHKRNSLKYTREKKSKLIALLGSASSGCQCGTEEGHCSCTETVSSISSKRVHPLRGQSFIVDDTKEAEAGVTTPLRTGSSGDAPVPFPELTDDKAGNILHCKTGMCRGKCLCSPTSKLLPNVEDVTDPDRALVTYKRKEQATPSTSSTGSSSSNSADSTEESSV